LRSAAQRLPLNNDTAGRTARRSVPGWPLGCAVSGEVIPIERPNDAWSLAKECARMPVTEAMNPVTFQQVARLGRLDSGLLDRLRHEALTVPS